MKKTFTPEERDAFARAVSAVEGLKRTPQQSVMFARFAADLTPIDDQVRAIKSLYSRAT